MSHTSKSTRQYHEPSGSHVMMLASQAAPIPAGYLSFDNVIKDTTSSALLSKYRRAVHKAELAVVLRPRAGNLRLDWWVLEAGLPKIKAAFDAKRAKKAAKLTTVSTSKSSSQEQPELPISDQVSLQSILAELRKPSKDSPTFNRIEDRLTRIEQAQAQILEHLTAPPKSKSQSCGG